MELLLIRHGQSTGNVRLDLDVPDGELTALGHRQAALLAERLSVTPPGRLLTSPLHRSLQTARPLSSACGVPMEVWRDLRELRMGETVRAATRADWERLHTDVAWGEGFEEDGWHYPGGETEESVGSRAADVVRRIMALPDERVAVVAHGGFNSFLIRAVLGITEVTYIDQRNACVTSFTIGEGYTVLHQLNDVEHLPPDLRS